MKIRKKIGGAGEMAGWLRAYPPLPEDPSSIPRTQVRQLAATDTSLWLVQHLDSLVHAHKYMHNKK